MQLKDRLRRGLQHTRRFTDRVLSEIAKAQDWVRRPAPDANHALWITGHLGAATNAFIGLVDPTKKHPREDFGPLFRPDDSPDLRIDIANFTVIIAFRGLLVELHWRRVRLMGVEVVEPEKDIKLFCR